MVSFLDVTPPAIEKDTTLTELLFIIFIPTQRFKETTYEKQYKVTIIEENKEEYKEKEKKRNGQELQRIQHEVIITATSAHNYTLKGHVSYPIQRNGRFSLVFKDLKKDIFSFFKITDGRGINITVLSYNIWHWAGNWANRSILIVELVLLLKS